MNEQVVQAIRRWRYDPVAFVREVFNVEPDLWQQEVLQALLTKKRVAMLACKGPGKSCLEAWAVLWFLATRGGHDPVSHPKVFATSVTGTNLADGLWSELSKWLKRSPILDSQFVWTSEKVARKTHPETWYAGARTWSQSANAEQQAETLAGKHAESIMFVLDESGGIPDAVAVTAEAVLANPGDKVILQGGNPSARAGPLFRAATKESHLWHVTHITGDPDDPMRSPRIDKTWAQQMIDTWGRDSDFVRVNVLGLFPKTGAEFLIGDTTMDKATLRRVPHRAYDHHARVCGVDVARHGQDSSVITCRQGPMSWKPEEKRIPDLVLLAEALAQFFKKWQPHYIFVDANGMGWSVIDNLNRLGWGHRVIAVDVNHNPEDMRRFKNKTTEMWSRANDWLATQGQCTSDEQFRAEATNRKYGFDPKTSQMVMETKKEMRKRGVGSPNWFDAFAMTFAREVPLPDPLEKYTVAGLQKATEWDYDPHAHGDHP